MIKLPVKILLFVLTVSTTAQIGCSRSANPSPAHSAGGSTQRILSDVEAAALAARLANDQCERQYRKRPFRAEQHAAVLEEGIFRWGGLEVGAPGGLSARVTFRQDGSHPNVDLYYSNDTL